MAAGVISLSPDERAAAVRRGLRLEYLTVGWNALESLLSVGAGLLAGSVALIGFGLDSLIEVSSGLALVWRLSVDRHAARRDAVEQTTLRLVGLSFFALAAYLLYDALHALWQREIPEESLLGLLIAVASLFVMPALARRKRRVAAQINSQALRADSRQTDICAYLSAILLGGLLANAALGWWWADPVAALVMIPIIVKEGWQAVRGQKCCAGEGCH